MTLGGQWALYSIETSRPGRMWWPSCPQTSHKIVLT